MLGQTNAVTGSADSGGTAAWQTATKTPIYSDGGSADFYYGNTGKNIEVVVISGRSVTGLTYRGTPDIGTSLEVRDDSIPFKFTISLDRYGETITVTPVTTNEPFSSFEVIYLK